MDNRPVGIFDSGLGGLTVVKEFSRLLPGEDIVYFGDTGRVPYGTRSKETIIKYSLQDIAFLQTFDIKAVVIACGTVSTAAIDELRHSAPLPVYGIVEPSARTAAKVTKNNKIGLLGTSATVKSGMFQRVIAEYNAKAAVFPAPCPMFVTLVENGYVNAGDVVVEAVAASYLKPLRDSGVDTLVLGCTHFPILENVIAAYMGPQVTLINSGAETAAFVKSRLEEAGLLAVRDEPGTHEYYVSDSVDGFSELAALFLERNMCGRVARVEIEQY